MYISVLFSNKSLFAYISGFLFLLILLIGFNPVEDNVQSFWVNMIPKTE